MTSILVNVYQPTLANTPLPDIQTTADITWLVTQFYQAVFAHEHLGPLFKHTLQLDVNHHIPHMVQFWSSILLGTANFKGNPIKTHNQVHTQFSAINPFFMDCWLNLWQQTLKQHFNGKLAHKAHKTAQQMADLILFKADQSVNNSNFIQ